MTMKKRLALPRDALLCSPELDKVASFFEKNSDQLHGLFSGFLLSMVIEGLKSKKILEMVESDDLSSMVSAANQADIDIVVQRYAFRRTHGVTTAASLERSKPNRTLVKSRGVGAKEANAPRADEEKSLPHENVQPPTWPAAAAGVQAPTLAPAPPASIPAVGTVTVPMSEQRSTQVPAPQFTQALSSAMEEDFRPKGLEVKKAETKDHVGLEEADVDKIEKIEEARVKVLPTNDPLPVSTPVAESEMSNAPSNAEVEEKPEVTTTPKPGPQYEGFRLKI